MAQPETFVAGVRRSDADIREDVLAALWHDDHIRAVDLQHLRADVSDGEVRLAGHLTTTMHMSLMDFIATSVPGVRGVRNLIVGDRDLQVAVAQGLAADPRTRPLVVRVGVEHGWVQLGGEVPDEATREAVEAVAGGVPGVRGVQSLPRIPGERSNPMRPRLQPEIGAAVAARDGLAGTLTRVVVHPRNRLVTHAIVTPAAGRGEVVIPAEAIEAANPGDVLLSGSLRDLGGRPRFDDTQFPAPPEWWTPPFPYRPGEVRWPTERR